MTKHTWLSVFFLSLIFPFAALAAEVDINHADSATLAAELKGVGKSRAEAIVSYRKEHAPFRSAQDLLKVKGIGQAVIDRNADRIRIVLDEEGVNSAQAGSNGQ
ncbi:MAG: competence protein ComEA [Gammaproteobacteria bacterium]|nr:competence protein ComEA [Gammaproteobacteria bacterium]